MEHATAELSCQFRENNYQELQYPIALDVLFYNAPRRSDIDNLCGSIMVVLVKANIIKNDNLNCINKISSQAVYDGGKKEKTIINLGFAEKVSPKFMPLLTKNFLTNQ